MLPVEPPVSVKGQRIDFGPPNGIEEKDCGRLIVVSKEIQGGAFDGVHTYVSYWKMSREEFMYFLDAADDGGLIELEILSTVQNPVSLNVVNFNGNRDSNPS